jgi:hypothetical protein
LAITISDVRQLEGRFLECCGYRTEERYPSGQGEKNPDTLPVTSRVANPDPISFPLFDVFTREKINLCCRTVVIYCGSEFGKVYVPAPGLNPEPEQDHI